MNYDVNLSEGVDVDAYIDTEGSLIVISQICGSELIMYTCQFYHMEKWLMCVHPRIFYFDFFLLPPDVESNVLYLS